MTAWIEERAREYFAGWSTVEIGPYVLEDGTVWVFMSDPMTNGGDFVIYEQHQMATGWSVRGRLE